MHTYIPTYLHTYIPTYQLTYIPTYIPTLIPTYLHTYLHTYIPRCIHTHMHACMHTDIHPSIHTYKRPSPFPQGGGERPPNSHRRGGHSWPWRGGGVAGLYHICVHIYIYIYESRPKWLKTTLVLQEFFLSEMCTKHCKAIEPSQKR